MLLGVSEFRRNDTRTGAWRLSRDLLSTRIEYLRHLAARSTVYLGPGLTRPRSGVNIEPVGLSLDSPGRRACRASVIDIIHTGGITPAGRFNISASQNVTEWSGGPRTTTRPTTRWRASTRPRGSGPVRAGEPRAAPERRCEGDPQGSHGPLRARLHGLATPPPLGLREIVTRARLRGRRDDVGQGDIGIATAAVVPGRDGVRQVRVDLTMRLADSQRPTDSTRAPSMS